MDCGSTFCCIDPSETIKSVLETIDDFGSQIILTEKQFFIKNKPYFDINKEITMFGQDLVILELKNHTPKLRKTYQRIMFAARTSGTIGKSKIIHVPYTCFWPNIDAIRFGVWQT